MTERIVAEALAHPRRMTPSEKHDHAMRLLTLAGAQSGEALRRMSAATAKQAMTIPRMGERQSLEIAG